MVIKSTSRSDVSLIAIVPDKECSMPTLILSLAGAAAAAGAALAAALVDVAGAACVDAASSLLQPALASWKSAAITKVHFRMANSSLIFFVECASFQIERVRKFSRCLFLELVRLMNYPRPPADPPVLAAQTARICWTMAGTPTPCRA